jgi:hypothetical protein
VRIVQGAFGTRAGVIDPVSQLFTSLIGTLFEQLLDLGQRLANIIHQRIDSGLSHSSKLRDIVI